MSELVLLDNEAVQALMTTDHPKHERALKLIGFVAGRRLKALPMDVAAPSAVRVEAGWSRRDSRAALINLFRIRDVALDRAGADTAADMVAAHGVSVADAHLGAVIAAQPQTAAITVITSDPDDIRAVAGSTPVTVVRL